MPPPNSSALLPPPPPPSLLVQLNHHPSSAPSLIKHKSWSPDLSREALWARRKGNHHQRQHTRRNSLTDEDLNELRGCIELGFGFGFESNEIEPRLSDALPALNFYHAVNRRYYDYSVFKSAPPSPSAASSPSSSECGSPCGPDNIFGPGENPQMVKIRLKQWAQVVACSVRQSSC